VESGYGEIPGRTLLLGLGNPILGDDGVGWAVVELLSGMLEHRKDVVTVTASVSPVRLPDTISGFDRLVAVDSITTGRFEPGTLLEVDIGHADVLPPSQHHFSMRSIPGLTRALGLPCPRTIRIYGIEINPPGEYGTELSPAIRARFPLIAEELMAAEFGENPGKIHREENLRHEQD